MAVLHPSSTAHSPGSTLPDFLTELSKAILRTGYYSADHPEARRSVAGLYAEYRAALPDADLRLSALFRQEGGSILVTAPGLDDAPLEKVLVGGAAALFTPKLLELMRRREIVAFTIGRGTDEREFLAFVELMSRPSDTAQAGAEAKKLDAEFVSQKIRHISVLFHDDIVGAGRRLSWQATLALSRLRKDLSLIPIMSGKTHEELAALELQLFAELIRPFKSAVPLVEILLNLDAALTATTAADQVHARDAIALLRGPVRLQAALLLEKVAFDEKAEKAPLAREILLGLVAGLDDDPASDEATALAERLVERKAISGEQLLSPLQRRLQARDRCAAWSADMEGHLQTMHRSGVSVDETVSVLGELLLSDRHEEAARIAASLVGLDTPDARASLAKALPESVLARLADLFASTAPEAVDRRVALLGLLSSAGEPGREMLAHRLDEDAAAGSGAIVRTLSLLGPRGSEPLLRAALERNHVPDPTAAAVLHFLASAPAPRLSDAIASLATSRSVEVRRLALEALAPLGRAAEGPAVAALADPDPEVKRRAIEILSRLRSRRMDVLGRYCEILRAEREAPAVRAAAASALGGDRKSVV
jgi:hypothetical protein